MSNVRFVARLSLFLSAASLYVACSDSKSSEPVQAGGKANAAAGETSAGSPSAPEGGAAGQGQHPGGGGGQLPQGGATPVEAEGGVGAGGADGTGGAADVVGPELPAGPCTYATTGGATLPPADAQFICTNSNRVFQNNGQGDYTALFGAGFFTTGNDSSTFACSISSAAPPAAGDTWTMSADHPGNCELSSQEGTTTNLWKAATSPAMGGVKITFVSATLTHGSSDPSDVYYLCTIKLSGNLAAETGASDVTISGTFDIKMLPLGA